MRKKQLAARLLNPLGLSLALQKFRSSCLQQLPILTYHRVLDIDEKFPFDERLISCSTKTFEHQMHYISKKYNAINFKDLYEHEQHGKPLPKNPIIITFDDGFDDNYLYAYPILKKYNLTATIFIATDYISSGETFWYDYIAFIIRNTQTTKFNLDSINKNINCGKNKKERYHTVNTLLSYLKKCSNDIRLDALAELQSKFGTLYTEAPETVKASSRPFSWENCKEMHENGIEIGSHSITHPILSRLDKKQLQYEIKESKNVIEKMLGSRVHALAFPNGLQDDFNANVLSELKAADYSYSCTFDKGINVLGKLKKYEIARLNIEPKDDLHMLPFTLAFPLS